MMTHCISWDTTKLVDFVVSLLRCVPLSVCLCLFLAVQWVGLYSVIVGFSDHNDFLVVFIVFHFIGQLYMLLSLRLDYRYKCS